MARCILIVWGVWLAACQGATRGHDAPPTACARVGDRCTVAAGKLGVCVDASVEGVASKIVCQSQH